MTDTLTPTSLVDQPRYDCRDAYVATLSALAHEDHRIVGVVNDSIGSSKLDAFKKAFPDRLINVGIAEQDMVGVAAGLANGGRIPFVSAASCFLTGRALEQIKADVAYSDHNVKLCGMSPGMAYGELGPTHHSIEDIAWLRAIDNITIVVPADPVETAAALRWAAATHGPVFIRVSRMAVPQVNADDYTFTPGRSVTLRGGDDVTLISNGTVLWRALVAAEQLAAEGIEARVISMPTVKPLDADAVIRAARETGGIVTAEESTVAGGLGSAVAETVVSHHPTRMRILGVPEFAPTGSAGYLLDRYEMSPEGIADAARSPGERLIRSAGRRPAGRRVRGVVGHVGLRGPDGLGRPGDLEGQTPIGAISPVSTSTRAAGDAPTSVRMAVANSVNGVRMRGPFQVGDRSPAGSRRRGRAAGRPIPAGTPASPGGRSPPGTGRPAGRTVPAAGRRPRRRPPGL